MFYSTKVLGVGHRFLNLGLNPQVDQCIPLVVQCVCDDSFRANAVVFREIRKKVQEQAEVRHLALNMKCSIHLGNLIRKSLVLSIPGYWSTVVRLGHLFQLSRFRRRFKAAMNYVVETSFQWIPVFEFPNEITTWTNSRADALNLWTDEPGSKPSKRFLDLMALNAPSLS
jgi:hypothetical protein